MVELLRMASDVVCNLAELRQVAWAADICMPRLPEGSAGAVICCADALRQLHAVGLAGETSAVVTLGRNGSVLGDWRRNQVRFLEFCPLDERAITDTPLGAGDDFLGALVLFTTTWASRGFLNDPCLACTLRATRYVAKKLHLPRESYTVEMTQL
jgi:sugar/nucleoside kinase (ribokinase family)